MRYLSFLFITSGLAACSAAPGTPVRLPTPNSAQAPAPDVQEVEQFLITSSASDFHAHRPPDPQQFRGVRLGHLKNANGQPLYRLCGEFLAAQPGAAPEWIHFTTIKTSGYEQWIGTNAIGYCQESALVWDGNGDLSAALKSRLDSLR